MLTLNAQRRDNLGRLRSLLHIRDRNRGGKKRASQRSGELALVDRSSLQIEVPENGRDRPGRLDIT